ncbi:MAG: hypothetical protein J6J42_08100 [Lachnospiraceae bacterium]|nr:hypothetical protein [Lachnospiraceae bacterium]MBP3610281.1 hypothetical protein [Lachnospiraceae bacterium]
MMEKKANKRFWMAGAVVLGGSLLFCSGMTVGAATSEPGSAGDPLITRSYLEEQLKGATGGYECITMKKGDTLEVAQGAQLIVYTGSATVTGNLIDLTSGSLANAGTKVQKYHSYLAPADGSGFTAAATCVIFLSGEKQ